MTAPSSKEPDLAGLAAVRRYFAERGNQFDAVVHCAGYNPIAGAEELTAEEFNKTQNINTTALPEICRAVTP